METAPDTEFFSKNLFCSVLNCPRKYKTVPGENARNSAGINKKTGP